MATANSAFDTTGVVQLSTTRVARKLAEPVRLIVAAPSQSWAEAVSNRLEELLQLPSGWDGYGAPPVTFENAYFALDMLRSICPDDFAAPQIVPGTAGDLQVEWHQDNYSIELHVRGPNSVTAYRQTVNLPDGEEIELTNDFVQVWKWIKEMPGVGSAANAAAA